MKLFIPPVANAKAPFRSTTDIGHHHGSFVGQYCQGQAQEITVEVILCKYSRQIDESARRSRLRELVNGVVCAGSDGRGRRCEHLSARFERFARFDALSNHCW